MRNRCNLRNPVIRFLRFAVAATRCANGINGPPQNEESVPQGEPRMVGVPALAGLHAENRLKPGLQPRPQNRTRRGWLGSSRPLAGAAPRRDAGAQRPGGLPFGLRPQPPWFAPPGRRLKTCSLALGRPVERNWPRLPSEPSQPNESARIFQAFQKGVELRSRSRLGDRIMYTWGWLSGGGEGFSELVPNRNQ